MHLACKKQNLKLKSPHGTVRAGSGLKTQTRIALPYLAIKNRPPELKKQTQSLNYKLKTLIV
jgi:hypothetical protein